MTDACETHATQDIGSGAAGEPGVAYDINGLGEPGDPGVPTGGQYPTNERGNKAHSGWTVSLPAFLVLEVQAHPAEFVDPAPDSSVFLGPKGARPTRSNFHTIWTRPANKPASRSVPARHATHRQYPRCGNRSTLRELMERMDTDPPAPP